jgi:hypothetical protein
MKEDLIDIFKYGIVMFIIFFIMMMLCFSPSCVWSNGIFNFYNCIGFSFEISLSFTILWVILITLL